MKVETAQLAGAFKLVDNVPANPAIPSSQFVRLEAKGGKLQVRLLGLLSAQVMVPCEGDLDCSLDRRALGPFLERAGDTITITLKDGGVVFKSGKANLALALAENPGFEVWAPSKGKKLQVLGAYMDLLGEYCKPMPGFDQLGVVSFLSGYGVMATDSLATAVVLDKSVVCDLFLPRQLAEFLPRLNTEEVWVEKNGMALRFPNGWIYQPALANSEPYPMEALQKIADQVRISRPILRVSPATLLEGLNHLGGFAWASEGIPIIQCSPVEKQIVMRLEGATVKADWKVPVTFANKPPERWDWSLSRLLPWLKAVSEREEVEYGVSPVGEQSLQWFRCKDAAGRTLLLVMVELGGR